MFNSGSAVPAPAADISFHTIARGICHSYCHRSSLLELFIYMLWMTGNGAS